MTAALAETLAMLAALAAQTQNRWWIIGSAAVVLHGGNEGQVRDVDLLMSPGDAEAFLRHAGIAPQPGRPSDRFRSQVFGRWNKPPIPIETFGGFELCIQGQWQPVSLETRVPMVVGGARIYVPSVEELVRLMRSFGRPKDLERARTLQP